MQLVHLCQRNTCYNKKAYSTVSNLNVLQLILMIFKASCSVANVLSSSNLCTVCLMLGDCISFQFVDVAEARKRWNVRVCMRARK